MKKKPNPNQAKLFMQGDATGALKSASPTNDPYLHQKSRVNDIKRIHRKEYTNSDKGKRDIDLVFQALQSHNNLTDREIQRLTGLETSSIPARRQDITDCDKKYKDYSVEIKEHRICKVMKTRKCSWELKKID